MPIPMTLYRGATCKADIADAERLTVHSQQELDDAVVAGFVPFADAIRGLVIEQPKIEEPKRRGRPRKDAQG